ncbi:MAG: hypothetical protein WDZ27_06495 [Waddliaceae bacterium]
MKIITIFLLIAFPVFSEIDSVRVYWKRTTCNTDCQNILQKYFSQVRAVKSMQMNTVNNEILLSWNPELPFSYMEVKTPLQMAGLGLDYIHVTVTGKINAKGVDPVLVSNQDGTVFYLISPASPRARHEQIITKNVLGRTLDSGQKATLIQVADANESVTISGPLFMPHRSPTLTIVIDSISIMEKKEQGQASPSLSNR